MTLYGIYLIIIHFYKSYGGLRYPSSVWEMELAAMILFLIMQLMRIDLGCRANRNENFKAIRIFTIFTALIVLFYLYFTLYTTYVLVFDIVFGSLGVVFTLV